MLRTPSSLQIPLSLVLPTKSYSAEINYLRRDCIRISNKYYICKVIEVSGIHPEDKDGPIVWGFYHISEN